MRIGRKGVWRTALVLLAAALPARAQSQGWSIGGGWRYMDIDYDNGEEGVGLRQFDLAYNGPRAWFAYSWSSDAQREVAQRTEVREP